MIFIAEIRIRRIWLLTFMIRLKREFLDQQARSQHTGSKVLTGDEWYSQQASRAVNHSVRRVIRHRHDPGAIIFVMKDLRNHIISPKYHSGYNLTSRVPNMFSLRRYSKFGDVVFTLTRFFRDAAINCPVKQKLTQIEKSDLQLSRNFE